MRPIEIAARVVLSVLFFYLGTKIGELRSKNERSISCPSAGSQSLITEGAPASDALVDCQTAIAASSITQQHNKVACTHPYELRKNLSLLHLGKATVPEDVFSFLHHPASPAKWNYFFTQDKNWESDSIVGSPCQEIYLTRTGSRASQPNKCVAVAVVPEGHESIVQQSHRVGFTALNTDQYQKDFPQDYSNPRSNENLLLLPLLKSIGHLLADFKAKMGEPIDPVTKERRAVIVMVANEGNTFK